jgi:hypothetical protein
VQQRRLRGIRAPGRLNLGGPGSDPLALDGDVDQAGKRMCDPLQAFPLPARTGNTVEPARTSLGGQRDGDLPGRTRRCRCQADPNGRLGERLDACRQVRELSIEPLAGEHGGGRTREHAGLALASRRQSGPALGLGSPPARRRGEAPDDDPGGQEHGERDDVPLVRDRKFVARLDKHEVHRRDPECGGSKRRDLAAPHGD